MKLIFFGMLRIQVAESGKHAVEIQLGRPRRTVPLLGNNQPAYPRPPGPAPAKRAVYS